MSERVGPRMKRVPREWLAMAREVKGAREEARKGLSRREWLAALALGAAACDSAHPQSGFLGAMGKWNGRVQGALLGAERMAPTPSASDVTPANAFPVYHIAPDVPMAPAGWMLRVGGLVARPTMFTLDELRRMTRTDTRVRHHCVEGWSAVASWHGVRLRDLAARVGADARAGFVEFRSFDAGYWTSWDRESAFHPQTLLAYGMNGADLTADHGAPLRLYGANKLGYKQCKYLVEVNFLPHASGGYWEQQGYEWFAGT